MSNAQGEDAQAAQIVAAANCSIAGAVLTVNKQRGCVVARTGVGVFTVTILPVIVDAQGVPTQLGNLSGGVATNQLITELQTTGGVAGSQSQIENTSDTVKTIRFFTVVPAAVDPPGFEVIIKRLQ